MKAVKFVRKRKLLRVPQVRPSVLDWSLPGDPWVGKCSHPDLVVLYLNNQPVSLIAATPLEHAAFNRLLFALHHRAPRGYRQERS